MQIFKKKFQEDNNFVTPGLFSLPNPGLSLQRQLESESDTQVKSLILLETWRRKMVHIIFLWHMRACDPMADNPVLSIRIKWTLAQIWPRFIYSPGEGCNDCSWRFLNTLSWSRIRDGLNPFQTSNYKNMKHSRLFLWKETAIPPNTRMDSSLRCLQW